jgi:hypothetical protein
MSDLFINCLLLLVDYLLLLQDYSAFELDILFSLFDICLKFANDLIGLVDFLYTQLQFVLHLSILRLQNLEVLINLLLLRFGGL